ncbi:hypothetical protein CC80DRAFT_197473 [Byssothecium circinans]|uniref:Uncharacterized protein n=1 Tax=Byssothecium circinans TaxID=147558 RepID=A0A6A5UFT0_9PLEO|nr:hypothetical protein CC80DRAFT_197473 [Byssothecium circinans]
MYLETGVLERPGTTLPLWGRDASHAALAGVWFWQSAHQRALAFASFGMGDAMSGHARENKQMRLVRFGPCSFALSCLSPFSRALRQLSSTSDLHGCDSSSSTHTLLISSSCPEVADKHHLLRAFIIIVWSFFELFASFKTSPEPLNPLPSQP